MTKLILHKSLVIGCTLRIRVTKEWFLYADYIDNYRSVYGVSMKYLWVIISIEST